MKTVWVSVVAIVYANTEYHVPPTVIVHYHIIKQKLNDQQNITMIVQQWNYFLAGFLQLSLDVCFSSDFVFLNIACAKPRQRKKGLDIVGNAFVIK